MKQGLCPPGPLMALRWAPDPQPNFLGTFSNLRSTSYYRKLWNPWLATVANKKKILPLTVTQTWYVYVLYGFFSPISLLNISLYRLQPRLFVDSLPYLKKPQKDHKELWLRKLMGFFFQKHLKFCSLWSTFFGPQNARFLELQGGFAPRDPLWPSGGPQIPSLIF
jgi:hypothetical protein